MRSTRSALNFSFLLFFLSAFAMVYVLVFQSDFIAHNIIFNTVIALFDTAVLLYSLYTIIYLRRGMAQWDELKISFPRGGAEPELKGGLKLLRGRLGDLISFDDGERNAAVELLNKALGWRIDFLFYAAGTTISLGLLGTFFGLTITMDGIRGSIDVLSAQDQVDAKLLVTSLAGPLGGMATAFSSSMFGLASSICAGLLAHFMGRATDGWVYDVEKWSFAASEENAANLVGEDGVVDATSRAINRLAGVLSRHVSFVRDDSQKLVDATSAFVQGQVTQQQTLQSMLEIMGQHSEQVKQLMMRSVEAVEHNNELTARSVETVDRNTAFVTRSAEASERSSDSVAQSVAEINQIRIAFSAGIEGLVGKLSQVERNTREIEQYSSRVATNGGEQGAVLEAALNALRIQQEAVMEGMRDLTEAKVSIVSAVRAAQSIARDTK